MNISAINQYAIDMIHADCEVEHYLAIDSVPLNLKKEACRVEEEYCDRFSGWHYWGDERATRCIDY